MSRTSIKTSVAAVVLFSAYLWTAYLAEKLYLSTPHIIFSGDIARPFNSFDYISFASLLLAVSFVVVSICFFLKDD